MRGSRSSAPCTLVLVEDDADVRFGLARALRALGMVVFEAATGAEALDVVSYRKPDVVVTDLRLPDVDALELLPRLHAIIPGVSVIITTGYGSIDLAVRAVKQGAENFLTKPVEAVTLAAVVRAAVERKRLATVRPSAPSASYIPRSSVMRRFQAEVERLYEADCPVLLLGETGTGKSVLARQLHDAGPRRKGPFVDLNCAGLSRELAESELFGHERGAFTGAHQAKSGLFDAADGGTLFLDEIGDIDVSVQPKVLKVVEDKRFRRVGEVKERATDVRLIAATHHDLFESVRAKRFRADLYYRIATVTLTIPPLRDRSSDIVPFAEFLLRKLGESEVQITPSAAKKLEGHSWPGNLRELKNVLERALLLRKTDLLDDGDIRFDGGHAPSPMPQSDFPSPDSVNVSATLQDLQREHIYRTLAEENGRVEAAARRLGMARSTLYQRLKDYGIEVSRLRAG